MELDIPHINPYCNLGWKNNVKNCQIPMNRSHMLSESSYDAPWDMLRAGQILGRMKLNHSHIIGDDDYTVNHCGKWYWVEFKEEKYLGWFLLIWEKSSD